LRFGVNDRSRMDFHGLKETRVILSEAKNLASFARCGVRNIVSRVARDIRHFAQNDARFYKTPASLNEKYGVRLLSGEPMMM
jgi:hypothetical protein